MTSTPVKPYHDRFLRLKRAADLLESMIEQHSSSMLKRAEDSGCLDEFELLTDELRQWLDDDDYYDDLAWNMENGQV